jgi:hypothetical protein
MYSSYTQEGALMKTTKKKPIGKTIAAALKAMENMVLETADLDVQLKQVRERLNAVGIKNVEVGSIALAGRNSTGSGQVVVSISSGTYGSIWPEWAYGVAEGALHFNKKGAVFYNDQPVGSNLMQVFCTNISV